MDIKYRGRAFCRSTSRGFTLFTALVAFILIVLSMLLVQSMVSTERSISEVITDVSQHETMMAVADLSRADALQVFNYYLRADIEDYVGRKDSPYQYFKSDPAGWKGLQQEFAKKRFGGSTINVPGQAPQESSQFAWRVAGHMINLLETTPDARGYSITLDKPDEAKMRDTLQKVFSQEAAKDEFFEVIGCPDGKYTGCVGTFYVTIDLSEASMDPITYESFPLVKVQEIQTGKTLKEAILPRGKFRVYVPVRMFKALAGAREVAYDGGLFSDTFSVGGSTRAEMEANLKAQVDAIVSSLKLNVEDNGFLLESHSEMASVSKDDKGTPDPSDDTEKIYGFTVTLNFREKNDAYMVSNNGEHIYAVNLIRNFT
ncbi:Uncharacterised protein [uncultured archaeon]|nr:Uncharacterised protein [uncultured archaeon]